MWPTQLFVHRPTLVFVTLALLAVAGAFSLATIVQQQFPNIDFPTITVRASYPGGSTTQIRDAIVKPIEDAIAGAPNLDHINTTVQQGQATIAAVFSLTSNKTTDLVQIQQRLLLAQADLPTDMPAPTVGTFDPAQATVVTLGVSSRTLAPGTLSAIVTNNIVPDLEQIDGVSNVNVGGSLTPAIEVQVNPRRLSAAGFTLNDIVSSISANNNREPGGIAYLPNRETTIDVRGDVTNVASVANLPIQAASQYTTTFGNASYSVPAIPGAPGAPSSVLGRSNERGRDRCRAPNTSSGHSGERGPELGARDRIARALELAGAHALTVRFGNCRCNGHRLAVAFANLRATGCRCGDRCAGLPEAPRHLPRRRQQSPRRRAATMEARRCPRSTNGARRRTRCGSRMSRRSPIRSNRSDSTATSVAARPFRSACRSRRMPAKLLRRKT